MRKLKTTFLLLSLSLFTFLLNAQSTNTSNSIGLKKKYSSTDWLNMMRDKTVNVHDVQKAFSKWYKIHHKEDKDKAEVKSGEEDDGAYEFFKRWEWLNLPRADRNGNRADLYKIGTQYQAYLDSHAIISHSAHRNSPHTPSSPGNWTYAGNTTVPTNSNSGNGGDGRVNRVRIMPGNTSTMYACAPSGGLWKTTNGGSSWSTNTDQLGDLSTSDVAINPLKTNVMYLATGDADGIQSIYPTPATIGVLKSYDGGNTWDTTGLAYTMSAAGANSYAISELLIDPVDTSVLIAATTFGIWRSANSGYSWHLEQSGWFHSIEFEPGHPSVVYAAASNLFSGGASFYRSTNNGISWTHITSGLPSSSYAEGFEIGVSAADTNYVYILADSNGTYGFEGLYRSTNHGVSFSTMSLFADAGVPNVLGWDPNGNDIDGQGWYTLSMAVSQTNADSLWVGGVNIWGSTDGGATWNLASNWEGSPYVHADIHGIQFVPGNSKSYIVGCDGGVFKTANGGSTWTDLSNNLEIAEQYCVGPEAASAGKWLTGWQDNGTNFSSTPWAQVLGGDGMDCFIDWSNNNTMYAENPEGALNKSTNAGVNWNSCTSGITEGGPWVTVWLQDPKLSTTLYAGFNNVWKSTNSASSWTKISTWGGGGTISAIAVDSSNTNYIYAAQSGLIELTTNGGTSWTNITGSLPVGSTSISGVAVSSKQPSHVWVTFAGYSSGNQVFASTNSGTSWTNISAGLPNLPVNCVVSESGSPNAIYVGTDQGVYYHDTVTNSWTFYNNGLPLVMIGDLKIYKPGKELIAASYGRGTWETPLYGFTPPIANFDGASTSVCAGNSVLFTDTSANVPTSWKWTFTGGLPATSTSRTQSVVYTTAGVYAVKLVVTNAYGSDSLTKNAYITVNSNPTVSASVTANVTCNGNSDGIALATPSGGTSPYTYSWSGGGSNATKTGLSAGGYTVSVTDKNGCSASTTVSITQPTSLNVSAITNTNIGCTGGNNGSVSSTPTGGTSPYTYSWSGGGSAATYTGLTAGTYTITLKDKNGCTATASTIVTQPATLPAITLASHTNVTCFGTATASVTANVATGGTAPYVYNWSPSGGTNLTASNLSTGSYTITVTDSHGCTSTASSIITQPTAMVITKDSVNDNSTGGNCNGEASVNITGGTAPYTYNWSPGGGTNDTINGKCSGSYCCTITDNNGCSSTVCITIENTTDIGTINSNGNLITIYPDPNNGTFTVAGVINGQLIEVYNAIGQKLNTVSVNSPNMYFNISTKADGLYLIRILNTNGSLVTQKKIIKSE